MCHTESCSLSSSEKRNSYFLNIHISLKLIFETFQTTRPNIRQLYMQSNGRRKQSLSSDRSSRRLIGRRWITWCKPVGAWVTCLGVVHLSSDWYFWRAFPVPLLQRLSLQNDRHVMKLTSSTHDCWRFCRKSQPRVKLRTWPSAVETYRRCLRFICNKLIDCFWMCSLILLCRIKCFVTN